MKNGNKFLLRMQPKTNCKK